MGLLTRRKQGRLKKSIRQLSNAGNPVVTVDELKNSLRIEASDTRDDTLLEELVSTATKLLEREFGLSMVNKTFRTSWDALPTQLIVDSLFPTGGSSGFSVRYSGGGSFNYQEAITILEKETDNLNLGVYPATTITEFAYFDQDNVKQVYDSENYYLDTESNPSRASKLPDAIWFSEPIVNASGIRIEFTAGFGADAADVPVEMKMAVMRFAEYLYENRGCDLKIPASVYSMMKHWKKYRL